MTFIYPPCYSVKHLHRYLCYNHFNCATTSWANNCYMDVPRPWDTKIWVNSFMSMLVNSLCFVYCKQYFFTVFFPRIGSWVYSNVTYETPFICLLSPQLWFVKLSKHNSEFGTKSYNLHCMNIEKGECVNKLRFQTVWTSCNSFLWLVFYKFWLNICAIQFLLLFSVTSIILSVSFQTRFMSYDPSKHIWAFLKILSWKA